LRGARRMTQEVSPSVVSASLRKTERAPEGHLWTWATIVPEDAPLMFTHGRRRGSKTVGRPAKQLVGECRARASRPR
jgi:hypothetical protein